MSTASNGGDVPSTPTEPGAWDEERYRCGTCGEPIQIGEVVRLMLPFKDGYIFAHSGPESCDTRFWDAPGEFAEWDSEVYG